jgi:hypothetical protein
VDRYSFTVVDSHHRLLAGLPAHSNKGIGLNKGETTDFREVMTPAFPKRGPDAGTMDQARPQSRPWHHTTLT